MSVNLTDTDVSEKNYETNHDSNPGIDQSFVNITDNEFSDIPDIPITEEELNTNETVPRKKSRWGNILRLAILLVSAVVFVYSAFMLYTVIEEYTRDAQINKKIDSLIVDSTVSVDVEFPDGSIITIPFKYDHEKLMSMNEEGVGYIYIPSINKRLPIVQTDNNDYYLRKAVNHTFSMAGSIFIDYRTTEGINSSHVIIHGHNRRDGTMFARLGNYKKEKFYQKEGNDVFYIIVDNKVMQYKIFSTYITEPVSTTYAFNFLSNQTLLTYAANMKEQSLYDTGVDVSKATQIVTLSTCTDDTLNRIIVQGTLVNTGYIK